MKIASPLYLNDRFFVAAGIIVWLFLMAYIFSFFFLLAQITLLFILSLVFYDAFLLFASKKSIKATRLCANRFSSGDDNKVQIIIENQFSIPIFTNTIDEIPHQFQRRDVNFIASLKPGENKILEYNLRPVKRGTYNLAW